MQPKKNDALPLFTVMIATSGKSSGIQQTLLSLANCSLPDRFNGTFVVENGEKSCLESHLSSLPAQLNIHYFYREKGNKSLALNFGISQLDPALEHFIFFTDDDITFDKDVLIHHYQAATRLGTGNYFGGSVMPVYEKQPPEWLIPSLPLSATGWPTKNFDHQHNYKFLGANWSAFAEDLVSSGKFDPRFGPGSKPRRVGQEYNMQERLFKRGLNPVFIEAAQVWHNVPENKSNLKFALDRKRQYGLNKYFVYRYNTRSQARFILSKLITIVVFLGRGILTLSFRRLLLSYGQIYVLKGFIFGKSNKL